MSDLEIAKWFITLNLYGTLDMSFVKSILDKTELTESQTSSLKKCVDSLKMRERVGKFDTSNSKPFLSDEIDFDEENVCCITNTILDDVNVIVSEGNYYSVESWKITHKMVKQTANKQKKKLSELVA
jgi:hypothetical protein